MMSSSLAILGCGWLGLPLARRMIARARNVRAAMQQRDYIQRLIEQLAATIASILGFAKEGRVHESRRMLDDAWIANLGMRRSDAERLDDATLRIMLREKIVLAANLFEAQALIEDAAGDSAAAESARRRAKRLAQS